MDIFERIDRWIDFCIMTGRKLNFVLVHPDDESGLVVGGIRLTRHRGLPIKIMGVAICNYGYKS